MAGRLKMLMIDATSFQRKMTGIETYGFEVSKELYQNLKLYKYDGVFLFHIKVPEWFHETSSIKAEFYSGNSKFIMEQFWIPMMSIKHRISKVYFPVFPPSILFIILRLFYNIKIYRTIFDTIMWKFPETTSLKNKLYMRPLETLGAYYYDKVFTISESSKNDIIDLFPNLGNKTINASLALKTTKKNLSSADDVLNKLQITKNKYILFVGTIEPRKNVEFILLILKELYLYDADIKLVLAGRVGWGHKELVKNPLYSQLSSNIVFTDYINDEELATIYANAIAFVFPSLYEGFGLPIIEAMEQGTPVIASNNSSIPEAVSNAGILVDGYDATIWAKEIIGLYEDEVLRNMLIQKGLERIKLLSWNQTVQIIMKEIIDEN
jgi:glycosyltransferase involved in cell wall biosynthesis